MPTFTPPTVADRARNQKVAGVVRRWPAHDRGKNVWKLNDGTYTEVQPATADVAITYHGGHSHTITSTESDSLTAAGYGSNIT